MATTKQPLSSINAGKPGTARKKKRNLPGNPDQDAEVVALSPAALMAANRFTCEVCGKAFVRDQNLRLHRKGHSVPSEPKPSIVVVGEMETIKKKRRRVYVCPQASCVHHHPSRALGDLTGMKKHYCRKHGDKKWTCGKCSKRYAVESDWKAHSKICGSREYRCDCGAVFARRDSYITHKAFCDALAQESARTPSASDLGMGMENNNSSLHPDCSPRKFKQIFNIDADDGPIYYSEKQNPFPDLLFSPCSFTNAILINNPPPNIANNRATSSPLFSCSGSQSVNNSNNNVSFRQADGIGAESAWQTQHERKLVISSHELQSQSYITNPPSQPLLMNSTTRPIQGVSDQYFPQGGLLGNLPPPLDDANLVNTLSSFHHPTDIRYRESSDSYQFTGHDFLGVGGRRTLTQRELQNLGPLGIDMASRKALECSLASLI